jgi:hypothetical protein
MYIYRYCKSPSKLKVIEETVCRATEKVCLEGEDEGKGGSEIKQQNGTFVGK